MTTDLPDITVDSPLVVHAPDVLVPGVVALDRFSPCNDVAVEAGPPVRAVLPSERWAFGILFPLDHGPLRACGDPQIVISLDVTVEGGTVGIMGVEQDLELPTTVETLLGPGRTTSCLTLDTPARTAAIVLRNVGETGLAASVTVQEIGAYRSGPRRLAPRTHDLGFDLFVVLALGKTGTQTIEQTLLALAPHAQVRRAHRLYGDVTGCLAPYLASDNPYAPSEHAQLEYGRQVAQDIALVRAHGGRVAFITAIREPIDGAISGVFHSIPEAIPAFRELHALGPQFVDLLVVGVRTVLRRLVSEASANVDPGRWLWRSPNTVSWFFGEEFPRVTGVDLLAHPVDRDAGFTLLREPHQAILVVRCEDLARGLVPGLVALTGRPAIELRNANRAEDKSYRSLYREFRASFWIPPQLADAIYDQDPYVRHFYTPAEIAAFKARWSSL